MKINNKEVTIITRCPFCGRANEVAVNEVDYLDWQDGALVEDEEDPEDWDEPSDYDLEVGFNPYEGCYDFDC